MIYLSHKYLIQNLLAKLNKPIFVSDEALAFNMIRLHSILTIFVQSLPNYAEGTTIIFKRASFQGATLLFKIGIYTLFRIPLIESIKMLHM